MRKEITDALDAARQLKRTQQDWGVDHRAAGQIHPGDYASMLSDVQQRNLQQIFSIINALQKCIKTSPYVTAIEPGTTTSLEVYSENPANYVVLECSVYGFLAALFTYGTISAELSDHIKRCVAENGLILITDAERIDLEDQGLYQELF